MARLKVAVLISGRGTNLQALIDACVEPDFPAEIVCVISNVADAEGLSRAKRAGIKARVVNHKDYPDRERFEDDLHRQLRDSGAELVCLAGFMRLLTASFVARWPDRLINIHPSLLPAYRGLDTHSRVLADGVRLTGCTVHFLRPEMDQGPIIVQAAVPVCAHDDADRLAARVLGAEHRCYRLAVRLIAEGRVTVRGGRAHIEGTPNTDGFLMNPSGHLSETD